MRQSRMESGLRHLTLSTGKSAGRNSSGRITVFHRGGGSKRLQRKIDLKRSTSSIGIVERIEYDPNRSSRIALVRWYIPFLLLAFLIFVFFSVFNFNRRTSLFSFSSKKRWATFRGARPIFLLKENRLPPRGSDLVDSLFFKGSPKYNYRESYVTRWGGFGSVYLIYQSGVGNGSLSPRQSGGPRPSYKPCKERKMGSLPCGTKDRPS